MDIAARAFSELPGIKLGSQAPGTGLPLRFILSRTSPEKGEARASARS